MQSTPSARSSVTWAQDTFSILTINGGSSSIRFALYDAVPVLWRTLSGKVERIGQSGAILAFKNAADSSGSFEESCVLDSTSQGTTVGLLLDWIVKQPRFSKIKAVGHRIVQGMMHSEPEVISPRLLEELHRVTQYDPDHLPLEIELIEAIGKRSPGLVQVACFDTAFHHTMPRVASQLAIPRRLEAKGVRRYGFHGLSYEFLLKELVRLEDPAAKRGRVILAHLGSGASLAAVRDGQSIDTSMGFTSTAGLVMGSRSGDLDPGLVSYLARTEQMSAQQFQKMVNHESGLLGVSETSSDMRDLLGREAGDMRAAEAIALFCYQAKKWIGAFAAALGGLDTLVFAGGVGENATSVRARICEGLEFLGVKVDPARNEANEGLISNSDSQVRVRVIRTDEERIIAEAVGRLLGPEKRRGDGL